MLRQTNGKRNGKQTDTNGYERIVSVCRSRACATLTSSAASGERIGPWSDDSRTGDAW